jgi:hypothetical protein
MVAKAKQAALDFRRVEQKRAATRPVAREIYDGTLSKLVH